MQTYEEVSCFAVIVIEESLNNLYLPSYIPNHKVPGAWMAWKSTNSALSSTKELFRTDKSSCLAYRW